MLSYIRKTCSSSFNFLMITSIDPTCPSVFSSWDSRHQAALQLQHYDFIPFHILQAERLLGQMVVTHVSAWKQLTYSSQKMTSFSAFYCISLKSYPFLIQYIMITNFSSLYSFWLLPIQIHSILSLIREKQASNSYE